MGFGSGMGKRLPVRRLEPSKAYFGGARQCRRPAAARGDKPAWFCASVLRLAFCFNPRPALASGATTWGAGDGESITVSIRAPLLRAGRLVPLLETVRRGVFQSAPRSCERGDPLR